MYCRERIAKAIIALIRGAIDQFAMQALVNNRLDAVPANNILRVIRMDNAAMLSGSIKRIMRWMELVLLRSWQRNEIVAHTSVTHTSVAHTSKMPDQDTIN
jgi:hypothetical protein